MEGLQHQKVLSTFLPNIIDLHNNCICILVNRQTVIWWLRAPCSTISELVHLPHLHNKDNEFPIRVPRNYSFNIASMTDSAPSTLHNLTTSNPTESKRLLHYLLVLSIPEHTLIIMRSNKTGWRSALVYISGRTKSSMSRLENPCFIALAVFPRNFWHALSGQSSQMLWKK